MKGLTNKIRTLDDSSIEYEMYCMRVCACVSVCACVHMCACMHACVLCTLAHGRVCTAARACMYMSVLQYAASLTEWT